jgi:hypothetical protein
MFFMIMNMTRTELHDAACWIIARSRTKMNYAAIDLVFFHEFFNASHELWRAEVLQWCVLKKQVVRGFCSVQHFVLIHVQLFKSGGHALVLQLINDVELPHDAQQMRDGIGYAHVGHLGLYFKFFGVCEQVQYASVLADGRHFVRGGGVYPAVACGLNARGWHEYELLVPSEQVNRVLDAVHFEANKTRD